MTPIFARADSRTRRKLLVLRQEAQTDKAPRVALRLQAFLLSAEGHTPPQIASLLVLADVIQEELGVGYHPGHVRKLLHRLGCSQRSTTRLIQADTKAQNKWIRYTY